MIIAFHFLEARENEDTLSKYFLSRNILIKHVFCVQTKQYNNIYFTIHLRLLHIIFIKMLVSLTGCCCYFNINFGRLFEDCYHFSLTPNTPPQHLLFPQPEHASYFLVSSLENNFPYSNSSHKWPMVVEM